MGTPLRKTYLTKRLTVPNKGLKIGVDFSLFLRKYLAVYKTSAGSPFTTTYEGVQVITSHLYGFFKSFSTLSKTNNLFFILDQNSGLEIKKDIREKRRLVEETRAKKIEKYLSDPRTFQLARKQIFSRTNYPIDYALVYKIFSEIGWCLIEATLADAQKYGAQLVTSGYLDYFITTDSDTLLFGSDYVKSFKEQGEELQLQVVSLSDTLRENKVSYRELVDIAAITGTDYHPGVPGVGPLRSFKYYRENNLPDYLRAVSEYFTSPLNLEPLPHLLFRKESVELWKKRLDIL